jgi:hypothetical protein
MVWRVPCPPWPTSPISFLTLACSPSRPYLPLGPCPVRAKPSKTQRLRARIPVKQSLTKRTCRPERFVKLGKIRREAGHGALAEPTTPIDA